MGDRVSKSEQPTFFIDRALGRRAVADALRKAGAKVEVHDDHFPVGALDIEWLPIVGERGWLILTNGTVRMWQSRNQLLKLLKPR